MVVTVAVAVTEALRDSGGGRESRRGNGSGSGDRSGSPVAVP